MKRLLLSLVTMAISVLFSLVVAELAVRLVRPQPRLVITPGGFYTPDPPRRYRLTPGYRGRIYNRAEYDNEIRINSKGLRGIEVEPGQTGVERLLSIGDSFVFGVGVEDSETFTAVVPSHLGALGIDAESLNAGIPAFGVPDAVSWLARHGVELHPDVVILSIFEGNDLVDASPDREEILLVDGLLVPSQSAGGVRAWLYSHSHLYVLLKSLLEQPGFVPVRTRLGLNEPWKVRVLREEFGVYRKSAPEDLLPAIEATNEALEELLSLASKQGFIVVAVLIPSEIQVDPGRWQGGLESLSLDPESYDPQVPTRIFSRMLREHTIPTLDLGPVFLEGLAAGDELYFRLDRHWTVLGHQLAAEAIGSFLEPFLQRQDSPEPAEETVPGEPVD